MLVADNVSGYLLLATGHLLRMDNGTQERILTFLINKGSDVNARNERGRTALMMAENPGVARLLLKYGANPNAVDKNGRTALMKAFGDLRTIEVLLGNGADPNARDKVGRTALMIAATSCNAPLAKLLINSGANVNAKDKDGKTVLDYVGTGRKGGYCRELKALLSNALENKDTSQTAD